MFVNTIFGHHEIKKMKNHNSGIKNFVSTLMIISIDSCMEDDNNKVVNPIRKNTKKMIIIKRIRNYWMNICCQNTWFSCWFIVCFNTTKNVWRANCPRLNKLPEKQKLILSNTGAPCFSWGLRFLEKSLIYITKNVMCYKTEMIPEVQW